MSLLSVSLSGKDLFRKIYRWAGIPPHLATYHPSVEISAIFVQDRCYSVLTNHLGEASEVNISGSRLLKSAVEIKKQIGLQLEVGEFGWKMETPGFGGAVVEWKS